MKKLFAIALFAAVGMSACSKDSDVTSPEDTKKYVQVTIPEEMVSAQTRTAIDGNTTNWVEGDRVAVLLYDGSVTRTCLFTADKSGPTTTFSGDVPVGSYTMAAAYYPYDCNASFDAVNKTFKHTWGDAYCTSNLADYDFMYTNIWEEPFSVNETSTVLPVNFTFRPLMARLKITLGLGASETPKKIMLETDANVLPTAGTIDALGNFTPSSVTNAITIPTGQKEFVIGLLPVSIHSTLTVRVMTTDGLTYSDKSLTLAGLKRNHHYTMSVPCNKKTVTITVPDAVDSKYGTHTWEDNGFYTVASQYDPDGLFDGWYFYRAEIKSDKNGDDKLKKNRIQLQVPAGFNSSDNGSFVTAPIQCDGQKTVKISFEVATNRLLANIKYRIGVTGNGPITEAWLRDRNNIISGNDNECRSGTQTHTFTVSNGQRIMIKIMSTAGSYHVEFADFTYTIE
mgnify:FL=1